MASLNVSVNLRIGVSHLFHLCGGNFHKWDKTSARRRICCVRPGWFLIVRALWQFFRAICPYVFIELMAAVEVAESLANVN